jgi:hypothetical protein
LCHNPHWVKIKIYDFHVIVQRAVFNTYLRASWDRKWTTLTDPNVFLKEPAWQDCWKLTVWWVSTGDWQHYVGICSCRKRKLARIVAERWQMMSNTVHLTTKTFNPLHIFCKQILWSFPSYWYIVSIFLMFLSLYLAWKCEFNGLIKWHINKFLWSQRPQTTWFLL